ncbi:MAG: response regulator transcription factor [Candidatus Sphingomonas phytovorans]|nr:response regulator transcription factor [Sphingomonas sp.]WEK00147.1 MAG: response regulator transcription factor [Sphingomonas sp.]
MRLLVVEDNERLGELLSEALLPLGYCADHVVTLADAEAALAVAQYDAIILDAGLPDGDGCDWLSKHRGGTLPPTILLTARGGLNDRIAGLDAGADDFLCKPFDIGELAARLRALLRRPGRRTDPVIRVGRLRYDSASRSLRIDDRPVVLTRRETDLAEILMRRAGTVTERSMIENALYNLSQPATENAVDAAVSRLRRKLDEHGAGGMLVTFRGVGFLLRDDG